MRILKYFLIAAFVTIFSSFASAAWFDPSFEFEYFETEHFYIYFHEGFKETAYKTAELAEEAHCLMTPYFLRQPEEKTRIVIVDRSDFANGLTTVIPYNTIYLYTAPPMSDSIISRYDDWLRALVFHEYAHILTMDAVRGYSKTLRGIFGKTYPGYDALSTSLFLLTAPPNILLPYWWIEGAATWAETEFTSSGRGRGTYYEMIFRTAFLEGNLPSVDRINGDIPFWPGGHTPYIYGLALKRHIAKEYGKDIPGMLSMAHAGRLPFLIDGPPERLTGRTYEELYKEALFDIAFDQMDKIKHLNSIPLTKLKSLDFKGEFLTNPRFSKDGSKMAFNKRDPHEHQGIVISGGNKTKTIKKLVSDHNITWMPDGDAICYTEADIRGGVNIYQDLYCYDLKQDLKTKITEDRRIKDPDASPDGSRFAIVEIKPETQNLAIFNPKEGRITSLTDFEDGNISSPRWSPDGGRIVFSRRDNEGRTALYIYDVKTVSTEKILESRADNINPVWSNDSRYIVFSSDMTGVYNLFSYSFDDGRTRQITHVMGGAFQPEVSGDRIVFSSYGSSGFGLAEIPYEPENWREGTGPEIKPYWPDAYRTAASKSGAEDCKNIDAAFKAGRIRSYSSFPTLLPRFWLPTYQYNNSRSSFGVFTGGRDVLGYNTFFVDAGYGGETPYFDLYYLYDRYVPSLTLRGYMKPGNTESGFISSVSYPVRHLDSTLKYTLGYHLKRLEGDEKRDSIFGRIDYTDAVGYPYSISAEEGRTLSLSVKNYSRRLQSEIDRREYKGQYEEYTPLFSHHVIYLNVKAGFSEGGGFQMGGIEYDGGEFPLRGYPIGRESGRFVSTVSLEYRFPFAFIFRGMGTKPMFFDRLYGDFFVDVGAAWDERPEVEDLRTGLGMEAAMDTVVGYKLRLTPKLGVAGGFNKGGETRAYMVVVVKGI